MRYQSHDVEGSANTELRAFSYKNRNDIFLNFQCRCLQVHQQQKKTWARTNHPDRRM